MGVCINRADYHSEDFGSDWIDIRYFSDSFRYQNQYMSRYLNPGFPDRYLAEGIRVIGSDGPGKPADFGNYHFLFVHKDDVQELCHRLYKTLEPRS